MSWDFDVANEIKKTPKSGAPTILEGTVVSTAPLTVSLCDGEVMAPPMPLNCVVILRN